MTVSATRRLYLTVDGEVTVEDDPAAAFLLAAVGDEIPAQYRDAAAAVGGDTIPADQVVSDLVDDSVPVEETVSSSGVPSPRSTVAEWQTYAASVGVDVTGLTKAQLIDAVEAAGQ
jgi:hypothetical protein